MEDLKIQSDEIIRLNTELKRVTKLKDALKSDNFKLIEEVAILEKESKEKDEMLEALISELEGNFKTDHTFRLIDKAKELINQ